MFGLSINDLTIPEKLFLHRRRLKETQKEAAHRYGINHIYYNKMERNLLPFTQEVPSIEGEIYHYEWCVIMRRRRNLKQTELAEKMNICKLWLVKMETGKVIPISLVKFWEEEHAKNSTTTQQ